MKPVENYTCGIRGFTQFCDRREIVAIVEFISGRALWIELQDSLANQAYNSYVCFSLAVRLFSFSGMIFCVETYFLWCNGPFTVGVVFMGLCLGVFSRNDSTKRTQ